MRSWVLLLGVTAAGCGRIGFDARCELDTPCVLAVAINAGATHARGPLLEVTVVATAAHAPLEVRIAEAALEGDCQGAYADDRWRAYLSTPTRFDHLVEPVDGTKKLCVWARDARGTASVISPPQGIAGTDTAAIAFAVHDLPVVEAFEVAGDPLRISWTVTDTDGLAAGAIDLAYTTEPVEDGAWIPLATGVGGRPADPTRAVDSLELPAPTAVPFVVRLVPRDAAGNRGIPAISDLQNAAGWRVFAGSLDRGIGSAGRAARLELRQNANNQFAIDPATHDVYATDHGHGVVKLDARTGEVTRLIGEGVANLPDDGPLPADARLRFARIRVGPDRKLYVTSGEFHLDVDSTRAIYQIDPVTRHCRRFLGGGTAPAASATPATVFLMPWIWDFDPEGNVYFFSSCDPAALDTSPFQLAKATMGPDGLPQTVTVIAGACAGGSPPAAGPQDPLAVRLGDGTPGIGSLAAWDAGRAVYVARYGNAVHKIIDGVMYRSNITTSSAATLAYDPTRGTLYAADDAIVEYAPNLTGSEGDLPVRTVVASAGAGRCADDGVAAAQACARVQFTLQPTAERLYFLDGVGLNEYRPYRIRFVDRAGAVRRRAAVLPLERPFVLPRSDQRRGVV